MDDAPASCGAYESYVRTYRGVATDERAAEFSCSTGCSRGSVLYALHKAEESLGKLSPTVDRVGVSDRARRALGRARRAWSTAPCRRSSSTCPRDGEGAAGVLGGQRLPWHARYFPRNVTTAWLEEVS